MKREERALDRLYKAREALVEKLIDKVLDDEHLCTYGELAPFDDEIPEMGADLADLNRTIYSLEASLPEAELDDEPTPSPNPWISEIIA